MSSVQWKVVIPDPPRGAICWELPRGLVIQVLTRLHVSLPSQFETRVRNHPIADLNNTYRYRFGIDHPAKGVRLIFSIIVEERPLVGHLVVIGFKVSERPLT